MGHGKNLNPRQDSNLWLPEPQAGAPELQRTHGEQGHVLGSYLTCVLYTARISDVDVAEMKGGKF